jgi:hypothetical protein
MAIEFFPFEREYRPLPERLLNELSLSSGASLAALSDELNRANPATAIRASILYLSEKGADQLGVQLISWLTTTDSYLTAVLDPEILSLESAKRVCSLFRQSDPYFFTHLSRLAFDTAKPQPPAFKTRALAILDDLSKDDPIVPWLRYLTNHTDERVRSKAVKVLCRLRPSKSTVELHLQSTDPRVRANAVEALWHTPGTAASSIFKSALNDPHHRVVANALVGLYYRKEPGTLNTIINLTDHPSPQFRLAMVWALGAVADRRGIPALRKLLSDPSEAVQNKAHHVLATFEPEPDGHSQLLPDNSQFSNQDSPINDTLYPQVA